MGGLQLFPYDAERRKSLGQPIRDFSVKNFFIFTEKKSTVWSWPNVQTFASSGSGGFSNKEKCMKHLYKKESRIER